MKVGMGKETRVTLVEDPLRSFSPLPPRTWGLRMWQEAGRAEKGQGQLIFSLASGKGRQGKARREAGARWRVASSNAQGLPYLLRELAAAPGRLGGELAPERLWRALAASGGARWAPTWPRMGVSRQRVQGPTEPEASGLDPFFGRSPRLGLQERNFFWLFFSFLPNLGDGHAPVTSPHSWGRVTWPPRP